MLNTDPLPPDKRGMALALALFALVIIGGMVSGSFLLALLEQQSGRNVLLAAEASGLAQEELWQLVSQVPDSSLLDLTVGGPALDFGAGTIHPGFSVQRKVARLADNLFLLQSRATRLGAGAQSATSAAGLLTRLMPDSATGAQLLQPISQRPWLQLY